MAAFGRATPGGQLYGGGQHISEGIRTSLLDARGSAYSEDELTTVFARAVAASREVSYAWAFANRLKWLWDPSMTPFVARWETILGLRGNASQDMAYRRAAIRDKLCVVPDETSIQDAEDICSAKLDGCTVKITRTPASASLDIRVTKPQDMAAGVFERKLADAFATMYARLPCWVEIQQPSQGSVSTLDTSSPYACYSLRKLISTYTGPAITVRRSEGYNDKVNVGFVNGELDVQTLLEFVGTGDGSVDTWWDQTGTTYADVGGSLKYLVSASGSRPLIVKDGQLITENDKPCIKFDGSVLRTGSTPTAEYLSGSLFVVCTPTVTNGSVSQSGAVAQWGVSVGLGAFVTTSDWGNWSPASVDHTDDGLNVVGAYSIPAGYTVSASDTWLECPDLLWSAGTHIVGAEPPEMLVPAGTYGYDTIASRYSPSKFSLDGMTAWVYKLVAASGIYGGRQPFVYTVGCGVSSDPANYGACMWPQELFVGQEITSTGQINRFSGTISEVLVFDKAWPNDVRAAVIADQKAYYSIV